MTGQPLRNDDVYDLTDATVVPFTGNLIEREPPAAVVAQPDALAPPKKKRATKKKTGAKRGRPAKKAKAPVEPVPESPVNALLESRTNVAPAGGGIVSRIPRIHSDDWLMIFCAIAIVALGGSLAFVIFG